MTETAEESQVLVQAGTMTTGPGNEEVSFADHKNVSPVIDGETPYQFASQPIETISIGSIDHAVLNVSPDPVSGRVRVVLTSWKNGVRHQVSIVYQDGEFVTTGDILPRGAV